VGRKNLKGLKGNGWMREELVTPVLSAFVLIVPAMIKKPIEACITTGLHNYSSSPPPADAAVRDEPWPLLRMFSTDSDPVTSVSNS
jgi:hypothetical protein